ncbi:DUF222 domain-containing protein [Actinomycetaceae bacterium L2_0104]
MSLSQLVDDSARSARSVHSVLDSGRPELSLTGSPESSASRHRELPDADRPEPLVADHPELSSVPTTPGAKETWARGVVFVDRFLAWCASVDAELVPVEVAVSMISKLAQMKNAIEGLRLGLAAHVDQVSAPCLPSPSPKGSPDSGPEIHSRPKPLPGDHPDLTGLLQSSGGQSRRTALNEVRQAQAIRDTYPLFGNAIRQGLLSSAYIEVLTKHIPLELAERAKTEEETLLEHARYESLDQFVKTVRKWLVQHAPLRAERKAKEAARAEKFSIFPSEGGYRLTGWLDALNGLHLDKALRSAIGTPSQEDRRSHAQRYADALTSFVTHQSGQKANPGGSVHEGKEAGASDSSGKGRPFTVGSAIGSGLGSEAPGDPAPYEQPYNESSTNSTRHALRTHIMVHVPLATLVQTEKAIEVGCRYTADTGSSLGFSTGSVPGTSAGNSSNTSTSSLSDSSTSSLSDTETGSISGTETGSISGTDTNRPTGPPDMPATHPISGSPPTPRLSQHSNFHPSPRRTRMIGAAESPPPVGAMEVLPLEGTKVQRAERTERQEEGTERQGVERTEGQPVGGKEDLPLGAPEVLHGNAPHHLHGEGLQSHFSHHSMKSELKQHSLGEQPSSSAPCPVKGEGLGRRGACLDGREEVTRQLGTVLARIRAGLLPDMLVGFEPAVLEDGTALSPSQLATLLCDSALSRIVLTARGEPLDASRAQRTFSTTQTKAVLARDRTCRYPGCDRGIEVGEIHHAQQWQKNGATVVDNAVLLCYRHHQTVHANQITITHHAGGFAFTRPDGSILGIRLHETRSPAAHPGGPARRYPVDDKRASG